MQVIGCQMSVLLGHLNTGMTEQFAALKKWCSILYQPTCDVTSQPNLGSIVEALRHGPRDTGLDANAIRELSRYWEAVRENYAAF